MVKTSCKDAPCHSPEELRERASRPGIPIDELVKEIAEELAAKPKR
ncbi:MAG: hypothetical protein F7C07_07925 [Desulfurococcales archaeon]|nr:hypothetical protein [Desulfurococcales archaeon]